mmetsp:Transcript_6733/g.9324  ORF Transcript_6733/g.9324 Transcript_6733/m.9324 type:complete len:363 (+) Transcript_6733:88-1176(+)
MMMMRSHATSIFVATLAVFAGYFISNDPDLSFTMTMMGNSLGMGIRLLRNVVVRYGGSVMKAKKDLDGVLQTHVTPLVDESYNLQKVLYEIGMKQRTYDNCSNLHITLNYLGGHNDDDEGPKEKGREDEEILHRSRNPLVDESTQQKKMMKKDETRIFECETKNAHVLYAFGRYFSSIEALRRVRRIVDFTANNRDSDCRKAHVLLRKANKAMSISPSRVLGGHGVGDIVDASDDDDHHGSSGYRSQGFNPEQDRGILAVPKGIRRIIGEAMLINCAKTTTTTGRISSSSKTKGGAEKTRSSSSSSPPPIASSSSSRYISFVAFTNKLKEDEQFRSMFKQLSYHLIIASNNEDEEIAFTNSI